MPLLDLLEPEGAFYVFVDASAVLGKSYKGTKIDSVPQMADILINEYNTAIVPCADFGFADCFRLSYAISIEQIEKGLDSIILFWCEILYIKKGMCKDKIKKYESKTKNSSKTSFSSSHTVMP